MKHQLLLSLIASLALMACGYSETETVERTSTRNITLEGRCVDTDDINISVRVSNVPDGETFRLVSVFHEIRNGIEEERFFYDDLVESDGTDIVVGWITDIPYAAENDQSGLCVPGYVPCQSLGYELRLLDSNENIVASTFLVSHPNGMDECPEGDPF